MIYSSLVVLAMSATAALPQLSSLVHLHPHARAVDNRVSVTISNPSARFYDVKVDGKTYTVLSHHYLTVKAPAGTQVFAESRTRSFHRGDLMLTVTPELQDKQINLN